MFEGYTVDTDARRFLLVQVDGGLSGVSRMSEHGSEDPIGAIRNWFERRCSDGSRPLLTLLVQVALCIQCH